MATAHKSIFIDEDGYLDVPKIMKHFIREHNRIHEGRTEKFLEEEGRERFITYVSAIINGTGIYSIEEQTRTRRRMDLVIHYLGRRYVVEMKIWHGQRYNEEGERQILDYLDYFGLDTGYMLSFNFNRTKEPGVHRVAIRNKTLFEGVV
ncbi:MAG: GxxExxY protein [Lachnospiraceae bacterium]|nr:GxxExxY protein [Lachnospiraceae bacterium]